MNLPDIVTEITRLNRLSENTLPGGEPYFEEPLVGVADADDPLFADYKELIGPFHCLPAEILPGAASVICWVLPVNRTTVGSNGRETRWPSRSWAFTRNNGEILNSVIRRHLVGFLEERGCQAVAPQLSPAWRQVDDSGAGIASTWSERHAAYAAGLGTFSLNDALITPAGIAHRLGSVITTLALPPSPRTAPDFRHNCLHYRDGSCGACIGRCPAGAISREGHDKKACRDYVYGTAPEAVSRLYGVEQTGCGLCQTGVPCERLIPAPQRKPTLPK